MHIHHNYRSQHETNLNHRIKICDTIIACDKKTTREIYFRFVV